MRDELLGYYERELTYLRQMGAEFSRKYPKIASRLQIEPDRCEDPHVERMIEAVAFLAGRVRLKLDDEFPELTESLLNILYPHFLAPVPSLSVVQFVLDPQRANLQNAQTIARDSMLHSNPVDGTPCRFRTCYPVTIWPVELASARFELPTPGGAHSPETRTLLVLQLKTLGGAPFASLREKVSEGEERPLSRLRFYLQGDAKVVHALYEHIFNERVAVHAVTGGAPSRRFVPLPEDAVEPVGFAPEEGLLPASNRSFPGYRLLQEYFAFPEKFLFFDVRGLERATDGLASDTLEIAMSFRKEFAQEKSLSVQSFRLHATPVINLFRQVAEPIRVTHLQPEYRVTPDVGRQSVLEVYSVDEVVSLRPDQEQPIVYQPFYSFKHGVDREEQKAFWYATRRPSMRPDDEGTEVYLSFVDLNFNPTLPAFDTVTADVSCSNRDLPARLPFGTADADFQLEGPGVFQGIRCLRKPTPTLRVPLRRGTQWRLLSHLSLNFLSLVEGGRGPEAIQEILKLYDFADSSANRQQIAGIARIASRRVLRPVGRGEPGFVRGLEITLELDEPQFTGSGVYLFASVLERFLALYASINSFSQLVANVRQREGVLKRWPPRAGEQIVL